MCDESSVTGPNRHILHFYAVAEMSAAVRRKLRQHEMNHGRFAQALQKLPQAAEAHNLIARKLSIEMRMVNSEYAE